MEIRWWIPGTKEVIREFINFSSEIQTGLLSRAVSGDFAETFLSSVTEFLLSKQFFFPPIPVPL